LPSETMIWQPEFTDKTLSRKTGAVHQIRKTWHCHFLSSWLT
ncbi:putative transposase domain protein, partial [Escherichia coli NE037]